MLKSNTHIFMYYYLYVCISANLQGEILGFRQIELVAITPTNLPTCPLAQA